MSQLKKVIKEKPAEPITKTLENLSVTELKALVYDRIGIIEQANARIKMEQEEIAKINQVIQKKSQPAQ